MAARANLFGLGTWLGMEEVSVLATASEEETQGLLSMAEKGLRSVADATGSTMGGSMNAAMQMAMIPKERWLAFAVLLLLGCLCMAGAFVSLPLLVLMPHEFARLFTGGSLFIMLAFGALRGYSELVAHLLSKERALLSFCYFGSVAGTLWASYWETSSILTLVFSCIQMSQLLWFAVSYIPGGTAGMTMLCNTLRGFLTGCFRGERIPL
mmetsp:Transcript_32056/g.48338  ORF Transcript_32056/g.48338 Transcript_32056/m.48338 type:complete len:210 (+) Transcript_32056:74-703(+)|eukprot:CAMPEP_0206459738 /NCGR_PEP_ID=MMETSP0324_2-20121206/24349_1 /ASSEMBLY_ACC=CAM_ASM_000836 /TAXON_ID=2866 /ORGANISM="Crypthecodinium cohnii, Strain Seligo" /LENGTH=209 /DNA_ID=CAMNT_0053931335 /DNA_START=88 /DNA_END=717 /DNA_ORIENTATION=+